MDLTPLPERFLIKTRWEGECLLWIAYRNQHGYGRFSWNGRPVRAHRFAYEVLVGPFPEGLVLDHLCRRPSCVNPAHLEPVTLQENFRRAPHPQSVKTHCPQGHEYTAENTRLGRGRSSRTCRACEREFGRGPRPRREATALEAAS